MSKLAKLCIIAEVLLAVIAIVGGILFRSLILGLITSLYALYLAYDIYKFDTKRK